jgi:hypothetical protein
MINANVWASLTHTGFESEDFVADVRVDNQRIYLHIENESEGLIMVTINLSDAILLKHKLDDAINSIFDGVRTLERDYSGSGS